MCPDDRTDKNLYLNTSNRQGSTQAWQQIFQLLFMY